MKPPIATQETRSQHCTLQTSHIQRRLLTCLAYLSLVVPSAAFAQTTAPAPLRPEAETAMKKGIIAAKQQEWLIAIQSFQEARKTAPDSPVVFYNLGLAESKIPGRELRAIAWFGAYLTANPNAPNATAVNDFILGLQIKNQANLHRLIETVEDAAGKLPNGLANRLGDPLPVLWAEAGDLDVSLRTANAVQDPDVRSRVLKQIGEVQAKAGDISGAQKTWASAIEAASLIQSSGGKDEVQSWVAKAQAEAGDIGGAQKTADLIQDAYRKSRTQVDIATVQTKAGDIASAKMTLASALKTAELIQDPRAKSSADVSIAEAQSEAGDTMGAQKTLATGLKTANFDADDLREFHLIEFSKAQAHAGDFAGALKTADLITDATHKYYALSSIAGRQAGIGDMAGARKTADLIQNAKERKEAVHTAEVLYDLRRDTANRLPIAIQSSISPAAPAIRIPDWLERLDLDDDRRECALNTEPFLNFAGYLKSLPTSDKPQAIFENLRDTARKLVTAQNVIDKMLKQQAKK
jgi:tetratricopeptide (TPR) repeat protein